MVIFKKVDDWEIYPIPLRGIQSGPHSETSLRVWKKVIHPPPHVVLLRIGHSAFSIHPIDSLTCSESAWKLMGMHISGTQDISGVASVPPCFSKLEAKDCKLHLAWVNMPNINILNAPTKQSFQAKNRGVKLFNRQFSLAVTRTSPRMWKKQLTPLRTLCYCGQAGGQAIQHSYA